MSSKVQPVILCGGQGVRLWPLSREKMPKQFVAVEGGLSPLQNTVWRLIEAGFTTPLIVTNHAYREIARRQLQEVGAGHATILTEPASRNTAPAICAAAEYLHMQNEKPLMLVLPADRIMEDEQAFLHCVTAGAERATAGQLVCFGMHPDKPETGIGYLELSKPRDADGAPQRFLQFIEKPSPEGARKIVESQRYVWNSGIYLISVTSARGLFEKHRPTLRSHVRVGVLEMSHADGLACLGPSYAKSPALSIESALLDYELGCVVPMAQGFADLRDWRAVWERSDKDEVGVSVSENALAIECKNSLLRSESANVRLVGVGLKNITAVATGDAVLITDTDSAANVSLAVQALAGQKAAQAAEFPRKDQPWGHYETLSEGARFRVRTLTVRPGGQLSFHSHVHRAEHWVVVQGAATVTTGNERRIIGESQAVHIPQGEMHQLENNGRLPLRMIEVQTGCYLGEDDIEHASGSFEIV